MTSVKDIDLDWSVYGGEDIFYIFNRQKCINNKVIKDENIKELNIIWGLLFLLLGLGIIALNLVAAYGLHTTCRHVRDILRPSIYGNISALNIVSGLCAILSGGVLLSHFTWDESDKAGSFIANLFGMLFILTIQTKIMLITGGLLVCVIASVAKIKISGQANKAVMTVIIVISWMSGLLQALLPYFFESQYAHPDYMIVPVASFGEMQTTDIDAYYSGQLVLLFAPFFLGLLLISFTIPGLSLPKAPQKMYSWGDEEWGTFTFTTLLVAFLLCHSIYFIIHFAGFWAIDDAVLFNLCSLQLKQLRYFLAFVIFVSYISAITEPLIYLTTNIETRDQLATLLPCLATPQDGNRVTPLLVDINKTPGTATGVSSNPISEEEQQSPEQPEQQQQQRRGTSDDIERAESPVDVEEPLAREESML